MCMCYCINAVFHETVPEVFHSLMLEKDVFSFQNNSGFLSTQNIFDLPVNLIRN